MSSSSQSKQKSKRTRSAPVSDDRFTSEENVTAFNLYETAKYTDSRILVENEVKFPILSFFANRCTLTFLLGLVYAFNMELFNIFLANMYEGEDSLEMHSYVNKRSIVFHKQDFATLLHLRSEGDRLQNLISNPYDWTTVNNVIRGKPLYYHVQSVDSLNKDARIIQHVLRMSIIPKAGDRINITPLLSLATYYIMSGTPFDEAQFIMDYIFSLKEICDPTHNRKRNKALGHIIGYMIFEKYQITEFPTNLPCYFTDSNFRRIFKEFEGKPKKGRNQPEEVEEEEEGIGAHSDFNEVLSRFDQLNTRLDTFDTRFDAYDRRFDRLDESVTRIEGKVDTLASRMFAYPAPPPPYFAPPSYSTHYPPHQPQNPSHQFAASASGQPPQMTPRMSPGQFPQYSTAGFSNLFAQYQQTLYQQPPEQQGSQTRHPPQQDPAQY